MKYYLLTNKEMPWGDYGSILLSGMTSHLPRLNGHLQLERTGPFQPNVIDSGIGDLIVTTSVKEKLEKFQSQKLDFKEVIKAHVTDVDWRAWNIQDEEPPLYPESSEPENYILERPHAPSIAEKMEEVWEVIFPENGSFERDTPSVGRMDLRIFDKETVFIPMDRKLHIFYPHGMRFIIVSEIMKDYFDNIGCPWIRYIDLADS